MSMAVLVCTGASMLAAAAAFILDIVGRKQRSGPATAFSVASIAALTLSIGLRTLLLGRFPLTSGADFLQLFCWLILAIHVFLRMKKSGDEGYSLPIVVLLQLVLFVFMPEQLTQKQALPLALMSPLLGVHVFTAALAYAFFAVAAGMAAVLILRKEAGKRKAIIRLVKVGFACLTFTIILGAVWAEEAWGSYWSWDPKETWALITWLIYAILLHRSDAYSEKKLCALVAAGFCASVFTLFGVSFLLPGLHSYAK